MGITRHRIEDKLTIDNDEDQNREADTASILLGISYTSMSPDRWGGRNFLSSQTSFNYGGFLGASREDEIQTQRSGADEDFIKNIDASIENMELVGELWEKNNRKYGGNASVSSITYREFLLNKTEKSHKEYQNEGVKLTEKIPRMSEISPKGKEVYQATMDIKSTELFIKNRALLINWHSFCIC